MKSRSAAMTAAKIESTTGASERMVAGVIALLLGTFIVFGVGFANSATVHNATHDTRHALGFPCH